MLPMGGLLVIAMMTGTSAVGPVVRRTALSTYGWGGYTWDGDEDPHGYGTCEQLRADLLAHGANSYNFLFYDSAGADYLLAVQCLAQFATPPALQVNGVPFTAWFTLIPPTETSVEQCEHNKSRACCSVPANSPLTPFNETALFNQSMGYHGCNDYLAWSKLVGLLSVQFPALNYLNVDDLVWNSATFTPAVVKEMVRLVRPNARLVPVVYYAMLEAAAALPLDGMLYYFRNDKAGGCPATCAPARLHNCSRSWPTQGCLGGRCAELTVGNVAGEIADVRAAIKPDMPIHVGVYVSAHQPGGFNCSSPSADYGRLVLEAALVLPEISGVMAYRMQTSPTPQRAGIHAAFDGFNSGCPVQTPFAYSLGGAGTFCCDSTDGFPHGCANRAAECCLAPAVTPAQHGGGGGGGGGGEGEGGEGGCGGVKKCAGCPAATPHLVGGQLPGWFCCATANAGWYARTQQSTVADAGADVGIQEICAGSASCCLAAGLEQGCQGVPPCKSA
jgi:hypothetical protein